MRSLTAPFRLDGGSISSTPDLNQSIKQKIINCLVISALERTGMPYFGVGTYSLLFENIDEMTKRDFITDALEEMRGRISDASIMDMGIKEGEQTGEVVLTVRYRTQLSSAQTLTFSLSATDFLTEESAL